MKNGVKKLVSIVLAVMMVLGVAPLSSIIGSDNLPFQELVPKAHAVTVTETGSCGEKAFWKIEPDGTLTIYGSGKVTKHPWWEDTEAYWFVWYPIFKYNIKKVIVEEGITSICANAFRDCSSMQSLSLPSSLEELQPNAFNDCSGLKGDLVLSINLSKIGGGSLGGTGFSSVSILNPNCEIVNLGWQDGSEGEDVSFGVYSDNYKGKIYGFEKSTAQEYCEKYGATFISLGYFEEYNFIREKLKKTISVVDADDNYVNGAIVSIYTGNTVVWKSQPSVDGKVYLDGFDITKYPNATVSAHFSLGNGLELCSERIDEKGIWKGEKLSTLFNNSSLILKVSEPRWYTSLSVAFVGKNTNERETRYKTVKSLFEGYTKKFAEMTNGHCIINDVSITAYSSDVIALSAVHDVYILDDPENTMGVEVKTAKTYSNYIKEDILYSKFPLLGFVLLKYGNSVFSDKTMCHESGHLFFGLFDEYCSGYGYDYDFNGDGIDEEDAGNWSNRKGGKINRPILNGHKAPENFGVMDYQNDGQIELSNTSKYSYLSDVPFDASHKEWYTKHYYEYQQSTEETVADFLTGMASSAGYVATYTLSNGKTQKAKYGYSKIDISNYQFNSVGISSQIDNLVYDENFSTLQFGYDQNTIYSTVENNANITSAYLITDGEISVVNENNGTYQFQCPQNNATFIISIEENGNIISQEYDISVFEDGDLVYVSYPNDICQQEYYSASKTINVLNCQGEHTISRILTTDDLCNYVDTSWFRRETDEYYSIIPTAMSYGEKNEFLYNCDISEEGTYVLMSKKAQEKASSTISNINMTMNNEDGMLYLSFDDESETNTYIIYYSTESSNGVVNTENSSCVVTNYKDNICIYPEKIGTYYFSILAKDVDGSYCTYENIFEYNYSLPDSNNDGIPDSWFDDYSTLQDSNTIAAEDSDGDYLSNLEEYQYGTNPTNPDTDDDNVYDHIEIFNSLNPLNPMTDGLTDDYIVIYGQPDVSIIETKPLIDGNNVICTLENSSSGKAMHTSVDLYVDDEYVCSWDVSIDSNSTMCFEFPVEYIRNAKNKIKIDVDGEHNIRDLDYENNTITLSYISKINFNDLSVDIVKGEEKNIAYSVNPIEANSLISWSSSNSSCVSVDSNGKISAKAIGEATITARSFDGIQNSFSVYCIAFDGAEHSEFDSMLIENGTAVAVIGYIGDDKNLVIPDTIGNLPVKAIDADFNSCSFESVLLGDSITSVSNVSFRDATELKSIDVSTGNTSFKSVDGVLYNDSVTKLIKYPQHKEQGKWQLPDSVTSIGENAFSFCKTINSLTIHYDVSLIGENAFVGCDNLTISCYKNSAAYTQAIKDNVTFTVIPLDATDIIVSGIKKRFAMGVSYSINVTPVSEYSDEIMLWSSSNDDVICVDNDGTVTTNNTGRATITVRTSRNTVSKSFDVSVIELLPDEKNGDLYRITNVDDMYALSELVNSGETFTGKTMCLESDIDLTDENWIPIGVSETNCFSGVFDGNGHTVTIDYNTDSVSYAGLFGYIKTGGIKDFTIQGTVKGCNFVGMIAAYMLDSALLNCRAIGNVQHYAKTGNGRAYVGGVVGFAGHCVIMNCAAETDITVDFSDAVEYASVGGVAGVASLSNNAPLCIVNSYCSGDIVVGGNKFGSSHGITSSCKYYVGGIAGFLKDDAVNNYYYGTITDKDENSIKKIGYAFGFVNPEYTSANTYNGVGVVTISNNYYPESENAIGFVGEAYDATDWTTGISKENFCLRTGEGAFVDMLNANLSLVGELIDEHRAVLLDSCWADLAVRIGCETLTASAWKIGAGKLPVNYSFVCENHMPGEWIIDSEPTCSAFGTKHNECLICGTVEQATIDKLAHTPEVILGTASTCTTTGLTGGSKCSVCGEVLTAQTVINAKGHSLVAVPGKAATCIESGLTDGSKCSVCGEVITAQTVINAKGHSLVTISGKAATCTESGLTDGSKCSFCGEVITAQTVINAKGHSLVTVSGKAATCTESGLTDGSTCSVCGEVHTAQTVINAKGHTLITVPGYAATCTETGLTAGTRCSVCSTVTTAQTVVAALGHIDNNEDGVCDRCGADIGTEEPQPKLSFFEKIAAFFRRIADFFKNLFR